MEQNEKGTLHETQHRTRQLSLRTQEAIRNSVRAHDLIKRLQGFALNEPMNQWDTAAHAYIVKPVDMSPAQIKAAEILLNRVVPTLTSMAITQEDDKEGLDENAIKARIAALIAKHPELVQQAGWVKQAQGVVIENEVQQMEDLI